MQFNCGKGKREMHNLMKKLVIAGIAATLALGVLTACTKTTENIGTGGASAAEEELSRDDGAEDKEVEASEADNTAVGDTGAGGAPSGETELMGLIESIPEDSDDSFIVAKLVTQEVNGVDLLGTDPDDTKVTVVYSTDTKFVKQTIKNGGEDTEEREGSAADLSENFTVEMKGSYHEENVFFATEIRVVEVILE